MESVDRALEIAREATGVSSTDGAEIFPVHRLDRGDSDYYLVLLDGACAAVDVARDTVLSWASTTTPQLVVRELTARRLAQLGQSAGVQLVWQSCTASRSPLYPLWRVRRNDDVVYVDQQQGVWNDLEPGARGG
ncbi:MAG: hypothetical protein ABR992_08985 [Solirubrobacteraceae bacterium]|jgi:hypothetical protein